MRKESKEMAVTATTMKKEKRNENAATTFVNYLESWYQNEYLPNSTSSSTAAYYHWMIFNVIEPSLPDTGGGRLTISNAEYPECSLGTHRPKK